MFGEEVRMDCAWCRRHMAGPEKSERISHGLCPICLKNMMDTLHETMAKVDHTTDVGGEG